MGSQNKIKNNDALNSYASAAQAHDVLPSEEELHSVDAVDQKTLETQCHEHVCPQCTVQIEADDTRLRALAEMDNFKKRLSREWDEKSKYLTEAVLADLLPALDSLDLAILYGSRETSCNNMLTGITMTRKMLFDTLKNHGLTCIGELGEAFDPEIHEAVAQEERNDIEPGRVCALMQRGYRLKERLLRPAKVHVSTQDTQ